MFSTFTDELKNRFYKTLSPKLSKTKFLGESTFCVHITGDENGSRIYLYSKDDYKGVPIKLFNKMTKWNTVMLDEITKFIKSKKMI
jgi:hypothetical protein